MYYSILIYLRNFQSSTFIVVNDLVMNTQMIYRFATKSWYFTQRSANTSLYSILSFCSFYKSNDLICLHTHRLKQARDYTKPIYSLTYWMRYSCKSKANWVLFNGCRFSQPILLAVNNMSFNHFVYLCGWVCVCVGVCKFLCYSSCAVFPYTRIRVATISSQYSTNKWMKFWMIISY